MEVSINAGISVIFTPEKKKAKNYTLEENIKDIWNRMASQLEKISKLL